MTYLKSHSLASVMFIAEKHQIATEDSHIQWGQFTHFSSFYSLKDRIWVYDKFPNADEPGFVFESEIFLSDETVQHSRIVYEFMDMLSDLGGVFQLIFMFMMFFLGPI
jgi:hypothetical protein